MTIKQTLTLTLAAVSLLGGVARAASPVGNVQSVQATISGSAMTVLWTPVPGAFSYRIYYSHQSILGNGGNYDDFEQTTNATTVYVFPKIPLTSETIFVGVLAVDKDGNESEGFEVEATVVVPVASASSSSSSTTAVIASSASSQSSEAAMPVGENPSSTAIPMGIRSVTAISATGILVTFTKDVHANALDHGELFVIRTLSGEVIPFVKSERKGSADILVTVTALLPDTDYTLGLITNVTATDGTNATPTEPIVRFRTVGKKVDTTPSQPYGRNPHLPPPVIKDIPPTDTTDLPESGAGILGIAAVAGAEAVRRIQRKKKRVV